MEFCKATKVERRNRCERQSHDRTRRHCAHQDETWFRTRTKWTKIIVEGDFELATEESSKFYYEIKLMLELYHST